MISFRIQGLNAPFSVPEESVEMLNEKIESESVRLESRVPLTELEGDVEILVDDIKLSAIAWLMTYREVSYLCLSDDKRRLIIGIRKKEEATTGKESEGISVFGGSK